MHGPDGQRQRRRHRRPRRRTDARRPHEQPGAIGAARGQSLVLLANGNGWRRIEVVGLPFTPDQLNATYYNGGQQGPVGALTDPFDAAVGRLERWGPVLGWLPLAGLDPWVPPDAKLLVEEMQDDLLPDLVQVMTDNPPPGVAAQVGAEVVHELAQLRQVIGMRTRALNTGAQADRAQITVRPLQAVSTSVATDTWASLALGFGTGDLLDRTTPRRGAATTTWSPLPWDGILQVALQQPWPFPWLPGAPPPLIVEQEVKRELAAIVLAPGVRSAPERLRQLTAGLGHDEGADAVDEPYHASVVLQTARPPSLPREPRAAGTRSPATTTPARATISCASIRVQEAGSRSARPHPCPTRNPARPAHAAQHGHAAQQRRRAPDHRTGAHLRVLRGRR